MISLILIAIAIALVYLLGYLSGIQSARKKMPNPLALQILKK